MIKKRFLCIVLSAAAVLASTAFSIPSVSAKDDFKYSPEYQSSPYYEKLTAALEDSAGKSAMEKTLAVALSQEGYKNYSTQGVDIEQARADDLLWTGAELRMNAAQTGNTEYTRWAQRYVMDRAEDTQYLDCDWCAIFVGWSIKQVGKEPSDYGYSPGVGEFQRSAAAKNTYHENDGSYTPRPGDFVICRSSDCPRNSHIGVVIAVNGDEFTTIEGNTRGGGGVWCYTSIVSENTRYLSSWTTQGFISTDLAGASIQTSGGSSTGGGGTQFDFTFSRYKPGGGSSSGSGNSGGVIIEDSQLAEVDKNYKGKTYREIKGRDLTSEERYRIEKIVHGEEGMYKEGCYLIAQCIRDAIVYNHADIMKLHLSSSQGGMGYEGYYTTEEPGRLMFMYDVSGGFYSEWHETQHFILQYKTTRFFDMW